MKFVTILFLIYSSSLFFDMIICKKHQALKNRDRSLQLPNVLANSSTSSVGTIDSIKGRSESLLRPINSSPQITVKSNSIVGSSQLETPQIIKRTDINLELNKQDQFQRKIPLKIESNNIIEKNLESNKPDRFQRKIPYRVERNNLNEKNTFNDNINVMSDTVLDHKNSLYDKNSLNNKNPLNNEKNSLLPNISNTIKTISDKNLFNERELNKAERNFNITTNIKSNNTQNDDKIALILPNDNQNIDVLSKKNYSNNEEVTNNEKKEKLLKLKKEEEILENEIKEKERLLNEKQKIVNLSGLSSFPNNNFVSNTVNYPSSNSQTQSYQSYLHNVPKTFQYNTYYPYYHYYWYYSDDYRTMYPQYFNYFNDHHPTIEKLHFGPLILSSGQTVNLYNGSRRLNYQKVSLSLDECGNGPKYYFTVKVNNNIFRVFLGDVNDFFNIQCLYMMNSVISIGQIDHAEKLIGIYDNPIKRIINGNERLSFNPFESSKLSPLKPNIQNVSRNVKILSFSLEKSILPRKQIVFYHKRDISSRHSEDIFRELSHFSKSGNVLFIVDHLQRSSVQIFKNFLVKYRKFKPRFIQRIRYKSFHLFPRNI